MMIWSLITKNNQIIHYGASFAGICPQTLNDTELKQSTTLKLDGKTKTNMCYAANTPHSLHDYKLRTTLSWPARV